MSNSFTGAEVPWFGGLGGNALCTEPEMVSKHIQMRILKRKGRPKKRKEIDDSVELKSPPADEQRNPLPSNYKASLKKDRLSHMSQKEPLVLKGAK